MTPHAVDWRSVRAKLRKIRELLDALAGLGTVDRARLDTEPLTRLAIERILSLVVDLAFACNSHVAVGLLSRAPDSYAESFDLASDAGLIERELAKLIRPSAGLRNVLVHAYLDVDQDRVAAAVPLALEQYGEYVRQAAAFARDRAT
jgi:uncharacterized protein YutE (UPF0331/DUF86 family)